MFSRLLRSWVGSWGPSKKSFKICVWLGVAANLAPPEAIVFSPGRSPQGQALGTEYHNYISPAGVIVLTPDGHTSHLFRVVPHPEYKDRPKKAPQQVLRGPV